MTTPRKLDFSSAFFENVLMCFLFILNLGGFPICSAISSFLAGNIGADFKLTGIMRPEWIAFFVLIIMNVFLPQFYYFEG